MHILFKKDIKYIQKKTELKSIRAFILHKQKMNRSCSVPLGSLRRSKDFSKLKRKRLKLKYLLIITISPFQNFHKQFELNVHSSCGFRQTDLLNNLWPIMISIFKVSIRKIRQVHINFCLYTLGASAVREPRIIDMGGNYASKQPTLV